MQEELAERERFEKEFEARKDKEKKEATESRSSRAEVNSSKADDSRRSISNPRVFLEVEVRGPQLLGRSGKVEAAGKLEFELFADVVPKTAENFRCLCTGEKGRSLHFEDSIFHRIIPGFMAQGGDFTDGDGTGGKSIYGKTFPDENFSKRHDARGALSMANAGKNTNGSQFFILFGPTPHLNGKHVVFGRLLSDNGQVLRKMEDKGTKSGDVKGEVRIVNCGEVRSEPRKKRRRSRSRSTSHSS